MSWRVLRDIQGRCILEHPRIGDHLWCIHAGSCLEYPIGILEPAPSPFPQAAKSIEGVVELDKVQGERGGAAHSLKN